MRKTITALIGLALLIPFGVYATQITVPSAPAANYFLVSTTTGAYVSSSTPNFLTGLNIAATSTGSKGFNLSSGCFAISSVCIGSNASTTLLSDNNTFSGNNMFTSATNTINRLTMSGTASSSLLVFGQGTTGINFWNTTDQSTNFSKAAFGYTGNNMTLQTTVGGSGGNTNINLIGVGTSFDIGTALGNGANSAVMLRRDATSQNLLEIDSSGETASNSIQATLKLVPTISQTSTAGYSVLQIQPTISTVGTGAQKLVQVGTAASNDLFDVSSTGNVGVSSSTPTVGISLGTNQTITTTEASTTYASTVFDNWFTNQQTKIEMNGSITVDEQNNTIPGMTHRLILCQDGTGSRAVTWGAASSSIIWSGGGTPPTQTTTANACDVYSFITTGATGTVVTLGTAVQNFP